MRPRPNGRGNPARSRRSAARAAGFNEAAAEWPREFGCPAQRPARPACFNEAAAEWPRECGDEVRRGGVGCGFNEAAAEWPREYSLAAIAARARSVLQ